MFEYIEDNPATWKFQQLPDIPDWFERELTALGGLNRHGKPNLRVVKANEVMSDRTEKPQLKYLIGYSPHRIVGFKYKLNGEEGFTVNSDEVPEGALVTDTVTESVPLGPLRYAIERWTSPEELEAANRFRTRKDADGNVILREFPREGIYEQYFMVEDGEGYFRALDNYVLDYIKFRWKHDQLPEEERERIYNELRAEQERKERAAYEERMQACIDGDLRLDPEERERREAFWANYDYAEEKARGLA